MFSALEEFGAAYGDKSAWIHAGKDGLVKHALNKVGAQFAAEYYPAGSVFEALDVKTGMISLADTTSDTRSESYLRPACRLRSYKSNSIVHEDVQFDTCRETVTRRKVFQKFLMESGQRQPDGATILLELGQRPRPNGVSGTEYHNMRKTLLTAMRQAKRKNIKNKTCLARGLVVTTSPRRRVRRDSRRT